MGIQRVAQQLLPEEEIVGVTPEKDYVPLLVEFYPGGEPRITDIPEIIDSIIVRPRAKRSVFHPSLMESLLASLFLIDVLGDRGMPGIRLVLPYFPGARQDRINPEGDMLFTARSIAKLINMTDNLSSVAILDPHSDVTPALLHNVEVYDSTFVWGPEHDWSGWNYHGVIAPDAGAVKRAHKVAQLLDVPYVIHAWKDRRIDTGEIMGFGLEKPPRDSTHYLIVDDICDGGATFVGLGRVIQKHDITADLFVTHGIFSSPGNLAMLKNYYGRIYCSDSVLVSDEARAEGVHVIPTVERMIHF